MSNEKSCMQALGSLDYETAVTIGSYIGELEEKIKNRDKEMAELIARNLVAWDNSKDKREGLLPWVYVTNLYWYKQLTGEEYRQYRAIHKFNIE